MIRQQLVDRVLTLTLDRPAKRNALDRATIDALTAALKAAVGGSARVVVLRGSGEAFSAGADLDQLKAMRTATPADNLADSQALADLFGMMVYLPLPVIAAVHGPAMAGGAGLVAACDVAIASEQATLGFPETLIGFVPAIVSGLVVRKVGETQARRLLLGGERITAGEAHRIGLVTECVPADHVETRLSWWTERFTTGTSGSAVASTRRLLAEQVGLSVRDQLNLGAVMNADARASDDCKTGIDRFLNKEPQRW